MRSLCSVRAMFGAVTRTVGSGALIATLAITSLQSQAEWQDPLQTPAMKTLKAPSSLLLDVISAGDRLVAVGERGHIILSDDDGYSWSQANVPVITTLTGIYFVNPTTGWAVGHDAVVLKTEDAGKTWVKQFDGFDANKMVLEQAKKVKSQLEDELKKVNVMGNSSRISDVEEELENASYALEDAEIDFEDRSTKPLLDLWFKNSQEGFVIGAYGMIFKTIDGGKSWADWSSHVENPDRFHLNSIADTGNGRLMIVGEAGLMLRTKNGGDQWGTMFSPYEGSFFGVTSLNKQGVQFAFGLRGNLARSEDFGATWKLMDTKTEQSLIGATDRLGRVAYVVGNGGAFVKGIDVGRKWESKVRQGRGSAAAIIESKAGHFVIVGENGVELLDKLGERLSVSIKSIEG
mgnify:FL=1